MSRFYVPKENVGDREIVVEGNEAHHILDVMRLKDGDDVVIFDGTGKEYAGFIKFVDARGKSLVVEIVRTNYPTEESVPEIILAQSITKKDKMDYIIEKGTELGVSRIIPIVTQRTIVKTDEERGKKKVERWRKIAVEAAKQCGRADVPKITAIKKYSEVVKTLDKYDLVLIAWLSDSTVPLKEVLPTFTQGKVIVFIGPEGDFSGEEIDMIDLESCRFVSFGKRVLKSDTAGLYALSVLNYCLF